MILGNALSYFLTGFFFQKAENHQEIKDSVHTVLVVQTSVVLGVVLFFLATFRNRPVAPPSAVALAPYEPLDLKRGLKEICGNNSLLLLTITFSSFVGCYFSLGSIMSSLFYPIGFTPLDVASIGLIMLVSGVIGAAFTGWFLDKTAAYKKLILFLIASSALLFSGVAIQMFGDQSLNMIRVYMVFAGATMVSVLPAGLGLSIELTFPLQPALVNGVMQMLFQVQACIQSVSYSAIVDVDPFNYSSEEELTEARRYRIAYVMIPIFSVFLVSFICMAFVKEDLKRVKYNQAQTVPD